MPFFSLLAQNVETNYTKPWRVSVQVCELDIIFNFEKAYFILDEFLMGGEIQDTSKKSVLKAIEQADLLQEVSQRDSFNLNIMI